MTNTESAARMTGRKGGMVGWRIAAWVGAGLILLLPLVAMQFTSEVQWTGSDFVFAGIMLAALVGAFEVVVRLTGNWAYRAAVVVGAVTSFLLVWVNLAVGIVGSENNAINLIFFLPLLVGATGAFISDFRAKGMARTLWAMAAVQAVTGAVGFPTGDMAVVLVGVFVVAWMLSAWLFGKAARVRIVEGAAQ